MKIIEALKKTKDLLRKAEDIRKKIAEYCADLDAESPAYETVERQTGQIKDWLQAHSDILREVERLRLCIQKTNLFTKVSVEVSDGKHVTKPLAAWIHRRKELAKLDALAWSGLTTKRLTPANYRVAGTDELRVANVRKYYNQQERDHRVEEFTSEPSRIDGVLEIANATTELIEE